MRSRTLSVIAVLAAVTFLPACVGSNKGYRPYKGEKRPLENPPPDPLEAKLKLETSTYENIQQDLYFTQSGKAIRTVTTSVPRNPWKAYEDDITSDRMKFLLGPLSNIKKAEVVNPEDAAKAKKPAGDDELPIMPKKKEEGAAPEGGDKPKEEAPKKEEGAGE
jgi:hypothetical protein